MYPGAGATIGTATSTAVCMWLLVCVYGLVVCLETSLHPYDVLEAEPEVVSGYYVDYGGVVFMLLYLTDGVVLLQVYC